MTRSLTLALALALAGCVNPEEPIAGARPLASIPPAFDGYWRQIEACSGHSRPADVTFWVAPDDFEVDGAEAMGAYQPAARRITLTDWSLEQPNVIRHEMLHAVLPRSEAGKHPREYFVERCGSLVVHEVR